MNQTVIDILLVEDNPHEAELAIRSFRKHHLANSLLHIDDGEQALNFIFSEGVYAQQQKSRKPRLILLDLKLPKIDGLQILKRVKADERTKMIPVVILTSSREEKDMLESYQSGANSYIVKPVNFESFSKAVAELGFYWLMLNENPGTL
ncbi:MAG: response regulator [Bacteroidetes bacterium]|nr:response regulator [Bacteroidota bacterium]